jgi:hypothetical protein
LEPVHSRQQDAIIIANITEEAAHMSARIIAHTLTGPTTHPITVDTFAVIDTNKEAASEAMLRQPLLFFQ